MNESLAKHFGLSLIHVVGTTDGEVSMACLVNGCGWHRIDAGPLADLVDQAESHINESHNQNKEPNP